MTEQVFLNRIEVAALRTWDEIAEEYLQLTEECGEDGMRRDDVVDAVATHFEIYGEDEEAIYEFFTRDLKEQIKILRGVFKYAKYS